MHRTFQYHRRSPKKRAVMLEVERRSKKVLRTEHKEDRQRLVLEHFPDHVRDHVLHHFLDRVPDLVLDLVLHHVQGHVQGQSLDHPLDPDLDHEAPIPNLEAPKHRKTEKISVERENLRLVLGPVLAHRNQVIHDSDNDNEAKGDLGRHRNLREVRRGHLEAGLPLVEVRVTAPEARVVLDLFATVLHKTNLYLLQIDNIEIAP